ncbi:YfiR family protein [Alkaliflexus imshenetskii]|uniref:YfiR family protein n=1 Tax=Alkaliflexus imshenetskii TaxID=286730 RepID=UPI00047896C8|nr:YfiR family protein [Alkaliflexus imshenetskii]
MHKTFTVSLLLLWLFTVPALAQNEKFKALFLLNFAKNIRWLEAPANEPLKILIVGDKTIFQELEALSKHTSIGNRPIVVEHAETFMQHSHELVYLSTEKSALLPELLSSEHLTKSLIVTDTKNGCRAGAGINFITNAGKLSYEICRKHVEQNGLRVSSSILNYGVQIE